jgi:hypothetical protein
MYHPTSQVASDEQGSIRRFGPSFSQHTVLFSNTLGSGPGYFPTGTFYVPSIFNTLVSGLGYFPTRTF